MKLQASERRQAAGDNDDDDDEERRKKKQKKIQKHAKTKQKSKETFSLERKMMIDSLSHTQHATHTETLAVLYTK